MPWQALAVLLVSVLLVSEADSTSSDLTERVTRMARIGAVNAASFSPDGRRLSVIPTCSQLASTGLVW